MAVTATVALYDLNGSSLTQVAMGQEFLAVVSVANTGSATSVKHIDPVITVSADTSRRLCYSVGVPAMGPGVDKLVSANETSKFPFTVILQEPTPDGAPRLRDVYTIGATVYYGTNSKVSATGAEVQNLTENATRAGCLWFDENWYSGFVGAI